LREAGLPDVPNPEFHPRRIPIPRFAALDNTNRQRLIRSNPAFGRVVCRCENVTEAEIVEAIRRPCGARSVDGVKRRVRPGMGRCQGGFCLTRVMEILSRELDIPLIDVTKNGNGSAILAQPIRLPRNRPGVDA